MTWGILTTALGGSDIVDGNVLYGADLVDTFNAASRIVTQVYTGDGFDTNLEAANGTDTDDHEMDSIAAAQLIGATYLKISCLVYTLIRINGSGAYCYNKLQFQTQDLNATTYSDTMASTYVKYMAPESTIVKTAHDYDLILVTWLHTLTADEKTYGVQVKILAQSTTYNASGGDNHTQASLSNKQTIIEVI